MPTRSSRIGQGGRPRTFQDEDVFGAVTRVLAQSGYAQLTLEAVAAELGCTAPAISRRFGSKRGLIRAYLDWSLGAVHERFERASHEAGSPLEAMRSRVSIPAQERIEELGDPRNPDRAANIATFWSAIRSDPEFRERANQSVRESERDATKVLERAVAAGELSGCDTWEIGRILIAAWTGTTSLWPGDGPDGTLEERLRTVFDAIIGPYRTTKAT
jgi:AcrR family transcriptional regulator